jgi:hypothetical protein
MKFEVITDDKVSKKTTSSNIDKKNLIEASQFILSKMNQEKYHTTMWHNSDYSYSELVFYDEQINISKYIKIRSLDKQSYKQQGGK